MNQIRRTRIIGRSSLNQFHTGPNSIGNRAIRSINLKERRTRTRTRTKTRTTQTRTKQDENKKLRHKLKRKKIKLDRLEPVTRVEALILDDVILIRSGSLDTSYRVLDDATSSEER
ncbi:hypothetical protein GmHk_20G057059 [Glycine max]|nr:hypothetical protein GmHk_20G057059 [Glycine max]